MGYTVVCLDAKYRYGLGCHPSLWGGSSAAGNCHSSTDFSGTIPAKYLLLYFWDHHSFDRVILLQNYLSVCYNVPKYFSEYVKGHQVTVCCPSITTVWQTYFALAKTYTHTHTAGNPRTLDGLINPDKSHCIILLGATQNYNKNKLQICIAFLFPGTLASFWHSVG